MVVNGLHFVRRNERTWHHRFPDQRSPFRAGRVSSSAEGLRTRVSWHAAQDQPKWAHEWNTCQRTRKNARNSPFGNFHAENTNATISGRRLDVLQVMLQFRRHRCSQVDDNFLVTRALQLLAARTALEPVHRPSEGKRFYWEVMAFQWPRREYRSIFPRLNCVLGSNVSRDRLQRFSQYFNFEN